MREEEQFRATPRYPVDDLGNRIMPRQCMKYLKMFLKRNAKLKIQSEVLRALRQQSRVWTAESQLTYCCHFPPPLQRSAMLRT